MVLARVSLLGSIVVMLCIKIGMRGSVFRFGSVSRWSISRLGSCFLPETPACVGGAHVCVACAGRAVLAAGRVRCQCGSQQPGQRGMRQVVSMARVPARSTGPHEAVRDQALPKCYPSAAQVLPKCYPCTAILVLVPGRLGAEGTLRV